jgi:hypothetical protein
VSDQPREQSRSGCGAALAWFLAVGLIRAIGRELGWSDRAQVIAGWGAIARTEEQVHQVVVDLIKSEPA